MLRLVWADCNAAIINFRIIVPMSIGTTIKKGLLAGALVIGAACATRSQSMDEMWDKSISAGKHPDLQWFRDAKFGIFIHWGLYSKLGGVWQGKKYYGSGEWLMSQARIPAVAYAQQAADFNPIRFNGDVWAKLAKDAGARYLVITAKHHEGFAMFDSRVSDFTIVRATPYRKDPMKELAAATRKEGMRFGFYYSQFLDWHEANGGGNKWDFDESKKNYAKYYREKSIPQLKELMSNYGPLGVVWFDMPGGLTKEETRSLVDSLRLLQPQCLFSSRVGQGLGDYRDFGDSELPPAPIADAWEAIYTHNDTWGYIAHDMNFKSPLEIIRLLANTASKGGNLMLNVGPDGNGEIPAWSANFLRATGRWLRQNGESIYATRSGFIPAQSWGVTTAKPGKLYLHIFERPANGQLLVPGFTPAVASVYPLKDRKPILWSQKGADLVVRLPVWTGQEADRVVVVEYKGRTPAYDPATPQTVSAAYAANKIEAIHAGLKGEAQVQTITFSHYYGDWKHITCVTGMRSPGDTVSFAVRVTDPGDYRVLLEYACPQASAMQEGVLHFGGQEYYFRTLKTGEYDKKAPLMFIQHPVAIVTVTKPGNYMLAVNPVIKGAELFKLKQVILEPVAE